MEKELKEKVLARIADWKKLFINKAEAYGIQFHPNVEAKDVSWFEIIGDIEMTNDLFGKATAEACRVIGPFDEEEQKFLAKLPYYEYIKFIVKNQGSTPEIFGSVIEVDDMFSAEVAFWVSEKSQFSPLVLRCFIKTAEKVDFGSDILAACELGRHCTALIVSYVDELPEDFVKRREELEKEEQNVPNFGDREGRLHQQTTGFPEDLIDDLPF